MDYVKEQGVQVNEVELTRHGCRVLYKGRGLYYMCTCSNVDVHFFESHVKWYLHFSSSMNSQAEYKCFNCETCFPNLRSVAQHYSRCSDNVPREEETVSNVGTTPCPHCALRALNKRGLMRHIHRKHPQKLYDAYLEKRLIDKRWSRCEAETLIVAMNRLLKTRRLPLTAESILMCARAAYESCKRKLGKAFKHVWEVCATGELLSELEAQRSRRTRRIRTNEETLTPTGLVSPCECLNYIRKNVEDLVANSRDSPISDRRTRTLIKREINSQSANTGTKLLEHLYKRYGEKVVDRRCTEGVGSEQRGNRIRCDLADNDRLYKRLKAKAFMNHVCEPGVIELEPSPEAIEWFSRQFERPSIDDEDEFQVIGREVASTCSVHSLVGFNEVHHFVNSFSKDTACGTDRFSVSHLESVPIPVLTVLMNLFMLAGDVPKALKTNRTTLLAKKPNPGPTEWRPITVSSVVYRLFSKIVTARLAKVTYLSPHQRAFTQGIDGCMENSLTIAGLIREANAGRGPLFVCSLDLAKAFDSVSFSSIVRALKRQQIDEVSLNLLRKMLYNNATIVCKKREAQITRGVRQGDPISPLFFNLVIDELFEQLKNDRYGASFTKRDGTEARIVAVAFADDITLLCNEQKHLEKLLSISVKFFSRRGMKINIKKSSCLAIRRVPCSDICTPMPVKIDVKDPDTGTVECLPCIGPMDDIRILGTYVTPMGRPYMQIGRLRELLRIVEDLNLQAHSKVAIIRNHIVFKFRYQAVYGKVNQTEAGQADSLIRATLRKVLDLPQHVAIAFFHVPISLGGLGIERIEFAATYLRIKAEMKMLRSEREATKESIRVSKLRDDYLRHSRDLGRLDEAEIREWKHTQGLELLSKFGSTDEEKWYTDCRNSQTQRDLSVISTMIQGAAFKYLADAPNSYLTKPELYKLEPAKIPMVYRIRLGMLRVLANLKGSTTSSKSCRLCGHKAETQMHVLQKCQRTKRWQIERHNSIVDLLYRRLETHMNGDRGFILKEQEIVLQSNNSQNEVRLKPDLVMVCRNKASSGSQMTLVSVIDVTCAYECLNGNSLELAYSRKRKKYKVLEDYLSSETNLEILKRSVGGAARLVMEAIDNDYIKCSVLPYIIGTRGGWLGSNKDLFEMNGIAKDARFDTQVMRTAAERSINIFKKFMGEVRVRRAGGT